MRNITITCPKCGEPERCVGDPDEKNSGHSGSWFCFNCKAKGTYELDFTLEQT